MIIFTYYFTIIVNYPRPPTFFNLELKDASLSKKLSKLPKLRLELEGIG